MLLGLQTYMAGLQSLGELAIAVVHHHSAPGAAGLDGRDCLPYGVNAERRPQGVSTGPLDERHTRVCKPMTSLSDGY